MEPPNPNIPPPNPNITPQTEPPQSTSSPIPSPSPNPNPNPQTRPPFTRTWPQPPAHFQHFSSSSSSASPSSSATAPLPRGGVALGVPAHHPAPPLPQPSSTSYSPSYAQQFSGLGRNPTSVADSTASSNSTQVRQSIHGMQGMGMMGSMGSGSQMRPGGIPAHHQQRPIQPSLRPQPSPSNPSPSTQNFQGHGIARVSPMGSPASPAPTTSQNQQSHTQPWLSSVSQGKPPLPSPAFRPQMNPQSMQQRSHIPSQHHHPFSSSASQQQQISSTQQPQQAHQSQDHYGQQFPPSRVPQSLAHQQPISRVHGHGPGSQKPTSLAMVQQPSAVQTGPHSRVTTTDTAESGDRILSKRSIHELVTQIDPLEKLDPEVEDILVEIADEFVESITTFGCSLAKHRKSTTLEAKDILLHLERNWNMTLPGFGGDEIKIYKKPLSNDIHRERLAAIKKSMVGTETAGAKNPVGQAGNAKAHLAKPPSNILGSPKP